MKKLLLSVALVVTITISATAQKQPPLKVSKDEFKSLKPSTTMVMGDGDKDAMAKKFLEGGDSVKLVINLNKGDEQKGDPNAIQIREVEDRYENGQMKSSGMHTMSNEKDGQWYYFNEDGSLSSMAFYKNGSLEGPYGEYHENGQAKLICTYVNNKQSGLSKSYYEDGTLREEVTHKDGKKTGKMTQYFPNKKPSLVAIFVDDSPLGAFTDYHENGNKKRVGTLNGGTMTGSWKHYFENGKLEKEETRNDQGQLNGTVKGYFDNGTLKYASAYTNGVENCPAYKEYYVNGKIKMEGAVVDGKEAGTWKYYSETGEVKETQY
jgi:antitoxin component YwqK of YwqJK toxin-antitoxin module